MKNFVRRMRKIGNSGSTLISVMVVTTILSLFLITLQPIMLNYAKGSVAERDLKQADFSARSANDAIVKTILDGNATLISGINSISSDGSSLILDDFTFSSSQMGSVEARIERVSATEFTVITRASVNDAQRTIGRVINKEATSEVTDENALKSFYFNSSIDNFTGNRSLTTVGDIPVVVVGTFAANNAIINIAGDLVLYNTNLNNNRIRGNSILYVDGTLFTGSSRFRIQNTAELHYMGNIYERTTSSTNLDLTNSDSIEPVSTTQKNIFDAIPSWVQSTGTNYTTGMTLNGGSYYVIGSNTTITNITSQLSSDVTPSNPVYIIVRNSRDLILTSALDAPVGGVPQDPRVVFILEGSADLLLQQNSSAVVFGTNTSSRLMIRNSVAGTSRFYGQIRVGTLRHIGSNSTGASEINYPLELNYKANSTPGSVTWTVGQYKKATY